MEIYLKLDLSHGKDDAPPAQSSDNDEEAGSDDGSSVSNEYEDDASTSDPSLHRRLH